MNSILRDMYYHQEWADAEHWRAFEAHPPALKDTALFQRLHHIHMVEHVFLSVLQGLPFNLTKPEDFAAAASLKNYAREYHRNIISFFDSFDDTRLSETVSLPWFKNPPAVITVEQALTHAAMHSHYHRGQNATRLRELGGVPPLTDLVAWYWKGRPEPDWS